MNSESPRKRLSVGDAESWRSAVRARELEPEGLAQVVAVAFAAAAEAVIDEAREAAERAGEETGGIRRRHYEQFGTVLGISGGSCGGRVRGEQWVTLAELDLALSDPLLAPALSRELAALGISGNGLLLQDQNLDGAAPKGGERVDRCSHHTTDGGTEQMDQAIVLARAWVSVLNDVLLLERSTRDPVEGLNARIASTNWKQVREILGIPRVDRLGAPGTGAHRRLSTAGVRNLSDMVRSVIPETGSIQSYVIKAKVGELVAERQRALGLPGLELTSNQVDSCLYRLAERGEVIRTGHGVYQATAELKRPKVEEV